MITADPSRRSTLLAETQNVLGGSVPEADRDLLQAFASVVFPEIPDAMAFRLAPSALAERIRGYFRFVAHTITPEHQLYRGLPGLHVSVRNPDDREEAGSGSTSGHHHEVTIIETHTPDAPFIFESLKNYLQREGLRVFTSVHPIFTVRRQWERIVWIGGQTGDGSRELYCQFRIERIEAREKMRRIEHQVHSLLKSVFLAVEDYPDMKRITRELIGKVTSRRGVAGEAEAAKAFLEWLLADNYVHLGMIRYRPGPDGSLHQDEAGALGVFKDHTLLPTVFPGLTERVAGHVQPAADDVRIVDIDYCVNASAIHHLDPVDDLVVREWNASGHLVSATLLLGRLAKSAFAEKAQDIPLLKEKLAALLALSSALPNSHAFREMRATFNHFPKRELLYGDVSSLKSIIDQMVYLSGDDEIAVTIRKGRGYEAALIAFTDMRYSRKAEEELKEVLGAAFGPITFNTWADCGINGVLVYYFDAATLEHPLDAARVRELTRTTIMTWEDQAGIAIEQHFGPIEGRRLLKKYVRVETRSGLYRESTRPEEVPQDVERFEQLEGRLELLVIQRSPDTAQLKLFSPRTLVLSETLRTLQNLGLTVTEEISIPLALPEGRKGFLSKLLVEADAKTVSAIVGGQEQLLDALRALQEERATECPLNALVLKERLTWRQVEALRAFRNHLLQIRPAYNADTLNGVLLRNSTVARALFDLFAARFDPAETGLRADLITRAQAGVKAALRTVASLVDDEMLRALYNLVSAAVRTNFYQHPDRPVISVKVESAKVDGMVAPRPLFEIFVHSRHLQGIHLRFGKVARGGIRWSDRHDDFRTEILGLVKAQQLKNAVIVPVGSKGGFVLKGHVPPRPALDNYLIDRYRQFASGLLDVTDNLVGGEVVHPPDVVRHDENDPYLVVAADKGTAHLSDTANSVSGQYGFWLGDAFASGGSVGYDHKKEGITARGAWELVKHSFRLLGHDTQTQPFTMVGIGDMSGDVFGNGALRSRQIKLVAAFDHRHVFIDPSPDPEVSFVERQRLFDLPRSSWMDYNQALLSKGGGIYDRNAKAIALSPEAQAVLGLDKAEASSEEVMRAILTAKVDLLYNGGIGTYVKASDETNASAGDRANDRLRINGKDLRCRVVGEGGNLGLTQKGRIEAWMSGVLVNTDAVDNSGGVDMSDHEVNIKILLDMLVRQGVIKDRAERNVIIGQMTDEVSDLVLADNIGQARALSLDSLRSATSYDAWVAFVESLVAAGIVDRVDAALPSKEDLLASPMRERGLPRPVLCVLLGLVKNWAFKEAMLTTAPDAAAAKPFLTHYFPTLLREKFAAHFEKHPLRREIIATGVVNTLINNAGISFLARVMAESKADLGKVIEAYLEAEVATGAAALRQALTEQGRSIHEENEALVAIEQALEGAVMASLAGKKDAQARKALDAVKKQYGL